MQFRMFLPLVLLAWTPLTAAAQPPTCSFVLGFAALHSAIPDIVGDCLTNESHGPINGDALQSTTNGLLVWRKSDSLTAFTNGSRTWVDGPFGIQMRLDTQRFSWEPNPDGLAIIPTPTPGDRCHTGGLAFTLVGTDPGAGNVLGTFLFTNQLDVNCTFFGFPGAQLIDADGNPLPTNVVRDGAFANQPPPQTVVVPAHGKARFLMHWEQVLVGGETTCPESSGLAVIPPDEFLPLTIPVHIRACGQGRLDIGAVQPDSSAA